MNRVLIIGTTGSGKTTVAAAVARVLDAPHVELDALFWKPGWVEAGTEEFRSDVAAATSGERWIADGNYLAKLGDLLWSRADTVVWLDPPLSVIVLRLIRRTISRSVRRTELWAGNRERISNLWNKNESLVRWARRVHRDHQLRYARRLSDPRWSHITAVRLRSRRAVRRWLSEVAQVADPR